MARIVEHLPIEELEARYRAARDVTEARHYQAIWLLAQGRTVLEVAEVLAFMPLWVERLAARYNASGPGALGDRRRRNGRPASLLTPELLSALGARLKEPPAAGGAWGGAEARAPAAAGRRAARPASLLPPELLSALAARLKEPPEDGGLWSGPKVAAWMARHLGLAAGHPQRGWGARTRRGGGAEGGR